MMTHISIHECRDMIFPRLVDQLVPGEAAMVEDVLVGPEDAIRKPVVAHELPDVLDRVQLGGFGG